jgi:malate dehydrogenase (quinone)
LKTYTNVDRVGVAEKESGIGLVASDPKSNSQTPHDGSIETNFPLQKALVVKRKERMLERYCERFGLTGSILLRGQKMALGVGEREVAFMRQRYLEFKDSYPGLEVFEKEELKKIEPAVVFDAYGNERPEPIVGVGMRSAYTTVNFGALANSFMENARKSGNVDVHLNAKVTDIEKLSTEDGKTYFKLTTPDGEVTADYVVVNAGAYSLLMAHNMGYGTQYATLPIAGSFYMASREILNGKVYMVQNPKLPFAAKHGDPDPLQNKHTRFGPTALATIALEFNKGLKTFVDAARSLNFNFNVVRGLGAMLLDSDIRDFMWDNFVYTLPYFGKRRLLEDLRKIVPSLQMEDIEYAKGFGGVRGQIIDRSTGQLILGEARVDEGDNIVFNMTPSPGATSALGNAEHDARLIAQRLGLVFDEERFNRDLVGEES